MLGAVIKYAAVDLTLIEQLEQRFKAALAAFEYAEDERAPREGATRVGRESRGHPPDARRTPWTRRSKRWRRFSVFQNLKLLCWTCREEADRIAIARAALSVQRGAGVSGEAARAPLEDWRREVSAKRNDRAFRIP